MESMFSFCAVCGQVTFDHFMICDPIWAQAGFTDKDVAHYACVEVRLGRRLLPEDLETCPTNLTLFGAFGRPDLVSASQPKWPGGIGPQRPR